MKARPVAGRGLVWLLLVVAAIAGAPGHADGLDAGAATGHLRVPGGAPLAGYGALQRRLWFPDVLGRHPHAFWFRPHEGELDPLGVRALVLEDGALRVVWVAADLIAVDDAFTSRLARRLEEAGLRPGALMVSASHTHSGPGAFLDTGPLSAVSVDRLDATVRDALLDAVTGVVRRAASARAPAQVGWSRSTAPPIVVSRLNRPLDPEIIVLKVTTLTGRPVALLWNYAIHGTMLGPSNRKLSGDVVGVAGRELEQRLGVPALFVNGAVGDVSPLRHGRRSAVDDGQALAGAVQVAWDAARVAPSVALAVRTAALELPAPRLSLRNCLTWGGGLIPRPLTVPLSWLLPRRTELVAVGLGEGAWVTMPGELQAGLGVSIKREAAPRRYPFVAGLTNDYLGYFVSQQDYDRREYVSCASLYGPEGGDRLARAGARLLSSLPSSHGERGDRRPGRGQQ